MGGAIKNQFLLSACDVDVSVKPPPSMRYVDDARGTLGTFAGPVFMTCLSAAIGP